MQVDFDPVPWGNPTFEIVFTAMMLLILLLVAENLMSKP